LRGPVDYQQAASKLQLHHGSTIPQMSQWSNKGKNGKGGGYFPDPAFAYFGYDPSSYMSPPMPYGFPHHHPTNTKGANRKAMGKTGKTNFMNTTQHNTDSPNPCTTCYKHRSGTCRHDHLRNHPCTICGKDGHTKFNCQIMEPQNITCSTCQRKCHLPAACRNGAPLPKPGQQQHPNAQQPPQQQSPTQSKGSTPLTWV